MTLRISLTIIKWWCHCLDLCFEIVARPWEPEELPYRRMISTVFGQSWKLAKSYKLFEKWKGGNEMPSSWEGVRQELVEFTRHFWNDSDTLLQITPRWPAGAVDYLEEVFSSFFENSIDERTAQAFRMLNQVGDKHVPMSQLAEKLGVDDMNRLRSHVNYLARRLRTSENTRILASFAFRDRSASIESVVREWQERKKVLAPEAYIKQIPLTLLNRTVEELELSPRAYNCLKNANLQTIGAILQKTEAQILRSRILGRKSLNEVREILLTIDPALKIGALALNPGIQIEG